MTGSLITEQTIVDIINNEMAMPTGAVWVRNQNKVIPNDNGLYIAVGLADAQTISSSWEMVAVDDGHGGLAQTEANRVQMRENIQIDIMGRGTDAITRRWEVLAALRSLYATQQQEARGFKLCSIPTAFVNSSAAEGGSQLNRYSITVACLVWYLKTKPLSGDGGQYYDTFKTRVDDSKTVAASHGLIEFTVT